MGMMKRFNELLEHVKAQNAKTIAWVNEDPKNRWAGTMPEDPQYWIDEGIITVQALERRDLETYIYEGHKDAFGSKGHHYDFKSMSMEELRKEADYISEAVTEAQAEEKAAEERKLKAFKSEVKDIINIGAGDEETALRWMTQTETFHHIQDVEHFVWNRGILFTKYGRDLVKKLEKIVTYEQWEAA